jgi:hypothetical protein
MRGGPNVQTIRQLSLVILRSHSPSTSNSNTKLDLQCFGFSALARDLTIDIFLFNLVSPQIATVVLYLHIGCLPLLLEEMVQFFVVHWMQLLGISLKKVFKYTLL